MLAKKTQLYSVSYVKIRLNHDSLTGVNSFWTLDSAAEFVARELIF